MAQVRVLFAGQPIPKSPFEVDVDKALGDATKVTAKGPGLEPVGNVANKATYFDIYTAGQKMFRCTVEQSQYEKKRPSQRWHSRVQLRSGSSAVPFHNRGKAARALSLSRMEAAVYAATF